MALSSMVSRVPEKRKNTFFSPFSCRSGQKKESTFTFSILKKIKSRFSFRSGGQKKETEDEVLENIIQKDEDLEVIASKNRKIFSYESLIAATNNFTHFLGGGGYGSVYKGRLEDGTEIAVKKLSNVSPQGRSDFLKEADVLTGLQHRNVVKLLGYCAHSNDYLLVYEFLPYTLNQFLSSSNKIKQLSWTQRLGIIRGIARGLRYLHVDNRDRIVHRDMKPNNVLLDQNLTPKIADFGLSRFFPEDRTHVTATNNPGTWGYMPPEYMELKHVSAKMDSYSFGVMILELISGQQNFEFLPPPLSEENEIDAICLLDWAYKLHKRGKSLKLLDPAIAASTVTEEQEQVITCIEIGLLCVQGAPKERPDMESVVSMLTMNDGNREASTILKPGVWGYRDYRYGNGKFSAQDHSDQSEAIMPADEHQESSKSQDNSAEIPHDMLVDEHQSQHASSNSNQIHLEDPQSNSNTFLAQHESASGGASPNEGNQSEAQVPKGAKTANDLNSTKEDPLDDSFTFPIQDNNDGCNKHEEATLESGAQELLGDAIKAKLEEEGSKVGELIAIRERLYLLRSALKRECGISSEGGISNMDISLFPELSSLSNLERELRYNIMGSLLKVVDTFETKEKKDARQCLLSGFQEKIRVIEKLRISYRREMVGTPNPILMDQKKQVLDWSDNWMLNTFGESAKSQSREPKAHVIRIDRKKQNNDVVKVISVWEDMNKYDKEMSLSYGGGIITNLWEDMNKYDKEMSSSYGRLKALGQKYEKGKWVLPSFLAPSTESAKVLICEDSSWLEERVNLLQVKHYVKERLKDIDVGIECLDRYISCFKEWSKGLHILQHLGDQMSAVAEAHTHAQSCCSQQVCAHKFMGDNRFSRLER